MKNNIQIHPISEYDFSGLLSLFQKLADHTHESYKMLNSLEQMNKERDYIKGFVAKNDSGAIIGYCLYSIIYYSWVGKVLYLSSIFVDDSHRERGVGRSLFNLVIEKSKQENCKRIRWTVTKDNSIAIEFYEKFKSVTFDYDDNRISCELLI